MPGASPIKSKNHFDLNFPPLEELQPGYFFDLNSPLEELQDRFECQTYNRFERTHLSTQQVGNGVALESQTVNQVALELDPPMEVSINSLPERQPIKKRGRKRDSLDWVPKGWIVQFKEQKSGAQSGKEYRLYKDPVSGRVFRSKIEVLRYLESQNQQS